MKKLLVIFTSCAIMLAISIFTHANSVPAQSQDSTEQDSTINVISYFFKNDSVTYVIQQSDWRINGTDTTRVSGIVMTSQFVVTDSTDNGYKIKYTILDITCDTIFESPIASLQSKIGLKLSKKLIGTTIKFETNELGEITKFDDLSRIKRKANSLFKSAIDEIKLMPEMQVLKKRNVDINNLLSNGNINSDKLVDDYLSEIKMLFQYHGYVCKVGESEEHVDATESQYEHIDWQNIYPDPDDDSYHIQFSRTHILPLDALESIAGDLVRTLKNNAVSEQYLDSPVQLLDCTHADYTQIDYLSCGWPYFILHQRIITAGDLKKARQTTITLNSYK